MQTNIVLIKINRTKMKALLLFSLAILRTQSQKLVEYYDTLSILKDPLNPYVV